jgi:membrane protein implicated in regulation of membrane protease activity
MMVRAEDWWPAAAGLLCLDVAGWDATTLGSGSAPVWHEVFAVAFVPVLACAVYVCALAALAWACRHAETRTARARTRPPLAWDDEGDRRG